VDLVVENGEVARRDCLTGQRIGSPNIVEVFGADFFRLTDESAFEAIRIDHKVERTIVVALDGRVEERLGMGGSHGEENPQ
jgi:hypothetical protein